MSEKKKTEADLVPVKLKCIYSGDRESWSVGEVISVPGDEADRLVGLGAAERQVVSSDLGQSNEETAAKVKANAEEKAKAEAEAKAAAEAKAQAEADSKGKAKG